MNTSEVNDRLKKCHEELDGVMLYDKAVEIIKGHGFFIAEYGSYSKKDKTGYTYFNDDGIRENGIGILIVFMWKKVGAQCYIADTISKIDIYYED